MLDEIEARDGARVTPSSKANKGRFLRFSMAVMGSIPWVGGLMGASAALHAERQQGKVNETLEHWLSELESKMTALHDAVNEITGRVETLGPDAVRRTEEEAYLALVRKGFRVWDRSETSEKRAYVQRLLANAAGTRIRDDDIVRLFLDWIDTYHEAHFQIIRAVYNNRGITRLGIWETMGKAGGELPRENSSDADLFRMLIHDLSTGRIIRQEREVNADGEFLKRPRTKSRGPSSDVMESSFEDTKPYELSELGQEFVHYVLHDAVTRIDSEDEPK